MHLLLENVHCSDSNKNEQIVDKFLDMKRIRNIVSYHITRR